MSLPGGTHEFNHSQLLERFYFLKKGDGEWQSLHQVKISRILRAWVSTKPLEPIRSGAEAQLRICSMRPWVFLLFWSFHLESLPLAPNPRVKCCFPFSSAEFEMCAPAHAPAPAVLCNPCMPPPWHVPETPEAPVPKMKRIHHWRIIPDFSLYIRLKKKKISFWKFSYRIMSFVMVKSQS